MTFNTFTMKAIVTNRSIITRVLNMALGKSFGRGADVKDIPIPSISSNQILVKVHAVALNPTDFKHIDLLSPPHSVVGNDFAGEVTQVGDEAAKLWKVGDRVAGAVHGGLYGDRGAFAEYLKADADLAWKIPDGMDDTEATTYGVSASTAMMVLNGRLGLPWLGEEKTVENVDKSIFIYAGSTSAGLYSIQLAKAVGYKVVTTASPKSFDLVKKYGADAVFDYRSSTVAADIIAEYPNISSAMDCFSEGVSTGICAEVIKRSGGKVITLLPRGKSQTPGVEYEGIMLYTAYGQAFQWLPPVGPKFPASPKDRELFAKFCASLPQIVGTLKPIPISVKTGGFGDILAGLDELRAGQVSGNKLVVKL